MALRRPRLATTALAATSLILIFALGPGAQAQDPAGDAFCALLTPEEVGDALGDSVVAQSSFGSCNWASDDAEGAFAFLGAYWDPLPFDERMASAAGVDLSVGGRRAWFSADFGALYIELDQGVMALQGSAAADDVDVQAALTQLGELAVSRAGTLPPPATPPPPPEPSHADPALEALFPETIGDQALTIQSMPGSGLSSDVESQQEIEALLATQGKTLDDVSLAYASPADYSVVISAFRIAGADAAALLQPLLDTEAQSQAMTQTPGEVGGKSVVIGKGDAGTQYFYAKDDVIWIVMAEEPALTEVLAALP